MKNITKTKKNVLFTSIFLAGLIFSTGGFFSLQNSKAEEIKENPFTLVGTYVYDKTEKDPVLECSISDAEYSIEKLRSVDYTSAGTNKRFLVSLTGKYSGDFVMYFDIGKYNVTVTPIAMSKAYGDEDPVLTYTNTPLLTGDSFTGLLSREPGENIGEYKILRSSLDINENYNITFVENVKFSIQRKALSSSNCEIQLSQDSFVFSGDECKPSVTVIDKSVISNTKTLVNGVDYDVAYSNNINAGEAQVAVTLKGNYSGSLTKKFDVAPKSVAINWPENNFKYNGSIQNIAPSFVNEKDITIYPTVSYYLNGNQAEFKEPGEYKVQIVIGTNYLPMNPENDLIRYYSMRRTNGQSSESDPIAIYSCENGIDPSYSFKAESASVDSGKSFNEKFEKTYGAYKLSFVDSEGKNVSTNEHFKFKILIPDAIKGKSFKVFSKSGEKSSSVEYKINDKYVVVEGTANTTYYFVGANTPLLVGLAIGAGVLLIVVIFGVYFFFIRKPKIEE